MLGGNFAVWGQPQTEPAVRVQNDRASSQPSVNPTVALRTHPGAFDLRFAPLPSFLGCDPVCLS